MASAAEQSPTPTLAGSPPVRIHHPTPPDDRIQSIDVLRGVAVLGILVVNLWILALPQMGYVDTTAKGRDALLNVASWVVAEIVLEGKMRCLLSLLFGAGVILLTSRIEAEDGKAEVTDIYYRRTIWLLAFGVVQAYLLGWVAEFLYVYALVGLVLFPFRKMRAEGLIVFGLVLLAVLVPKRILYSQHLRSMERAAAEADAALSDSDAADADDSNDELKEHRQARVNWDRKLRTFRPTAEQIERRVEVRRSGYWRVFRQSVPAIVSFQSADFYKWFFWDVAGMMFLGMGLTKLGLFSPKQPLVTYRLLMVVGYGLGLPLSVFIASNIFISGFDVPDLLLTWVVYDAARLAVAMGHVGLVMLICKTGVWSWLTGSLAAAGRMALSNYVAQIVFCSLLFNGYGLGLYGRLERWDAFLLAIAIGLVQLVFSTYWLKVFRFGPMEWLWRSLTYLKRQPLFVRSRNGAEAPATRPGAGSP